MLTKPVLVVLLIVFVAFELGDCELNWVCHCLKADAQGVRIRREPKLSSDILGLAYPPKCYWARRYNADFLKIEYAEYGGMIAYTASQFWNPGRGCPT
ncbi:hypothetical protein BaRGS_00013189 [Batillaria attramentaria]|uniref:Uncharacterized protein n=1 Tax=Batillaria attramentaria TaxID=370345 RepID=A0ABD0L7F7_9CAEN